MNTEEILNWLYERGRQFTGLRLPEIDVGED